MNRLNKSIGLCTALLASLLINCSLLEIEQTPTKTKMLGLWEVVEAYDEDGESILKDINYPITLFHLQSDNSILSTAGPMFMMIVYGSSKYTQIASKIDQTFDYANTEIFTNGEWFIDDGTTDNFTLEMKLKGLPGQTSLKSLLELLNIKSEFLDVTIWHKFIDVHVEFDLFSDTSMTWEFDNSTTAVYNTKDSDGNNVLWNGFPVDQFSHCKFVFRKRAGGLRDAVANATKKQ
jgi:hypothetical protein